MLSTASGTGARVGRKKLWHENVRLPLPAGMKARMDAALRLGEDRTDLIREAIERELDRREAAPHPSQEDTDCSRVQRT